MTKAIKTLPLTLTLALALTTTPFALHSHAQESALLEELVVTARKREQNLQDVAIGVSLLSGKALAESQLRSADDLSTLLPTLNVQASSGPGSSSFNIRGIGTQSLNPSVEASVSTMVDGVVMGISGMAFIELVDIARVEVLRGPQGTLYGKNASGGVIHIITKDPTPEVSGTLRATAIEDDEYRLDGTISGPISDTLSYRLTGSYLDDGGFAKNAFNGNKLNSSEGHTLRGKLLWQPSEDLELMWSSDYADQDCECVSLSMRSIMGSAQQQSLLDQQLPVVPSNHNQDVNHDQQVFSEVDSSGHSLSVEWDMGNVVLSSITAMRDWENRSIVDLDNLPSNPLALTFPMPPTTEVEQFSQEFRLASAPADWGSYVVGAFFFTQELNSGSDVTTQFIISNPPVTRVSRTMVESDNIALFGELNYNLSDEWQLTLGARFTQDELKFDTVTAGSDGIIFTVDDEGEVSNDISEDDFSPKVALQWQVNDTTMTYLSYVSGYKGPAFDTEVISGGSFVEPETSDAFELGLKSSWFDNRLFLNVAVFYAEYTDFQAQASVDDNPADMIPGTFILLNAGKVSTQGVEIEFLAQPMDNWNLGGGLAYTEATIDEYELGNCSAGQKFRGECPTGAQDLSGGQLPYTPEWKLTLSSDYRIEFDAPYSLTLGVDMRVQDEVLFGLSQDPYSAQDRYAITDFRATLAGKNDRYRLQFFVKNVFDQNYATLIFAQAEQLIPNGYIQRVPKYANRTMGVQLRYDF